MPLKKEKKDKNKLNNRRPKREVGPCLFCEENRLPDYKDWQTLEKYLSDRKRIWGKSRTGTCAKHQRRVTREVKRARHLALLPFSVKYII